MTEHTTDSAPLETTRKRANALRLAGHICPGSFAAGGFAWLVDVLEAMPDVGEYDAVIGLEQQREPLFLREWAAWEEPLGCAIVRTSAQRAVLALRPAVVTDRSRPVVFSHAPNAAF